MLESKESESGPPPMRVASTPAYEFLSSCRLTHEDAIFVGMQLGCACLDAGVATGRCTERQQCGARPPPLPLRLLKGAARPALCVEYPGTCQLFLRRDLTVRVLHHGHERGDHSRGAATPALH